ncbi:serine/threonine-protein kinase [Miltoncostaea marina]|uniref:serine/threonine-protein kinase n=1 Tax=Miltoncostaea marina TaxID=2843215 RepID=UPI001C3C53EE|nr:serine/threonine-protein kinase [Miltoncostaea marina]
MTAVAPASLAGAWELGERIGGGGQATVLRARRVADGSPAAVKLFGRAVWADDAFRARFRRERHALAALRHPHVVPLLDAGEDDGRGYLVMPLARGGSLAGRLAAGPPPAAEALATLRAVAGALDAAHAAGLLHRDVTPANVLLDPDGPWLADFGIARRLDATALTGEGQLIGTAAYLAPEVIAGGRATPASDRYALAVTAFEVLTGERPFAADDLSGLLAAHVARRPPRASAVRPGLPRALDAALAAGLAKDPAGRPRSAIGLVEGLAAAFGHGAGAVTRLTPRGRRRRRAARLVPAALVAAGALAAGGAAAGLTIALTSGAAPPPPPAPVMVAAAVAPTVPGPDGEVTGRRADATDLPGIAPAEGAGVARIGAADVAATSGGWAELAATRRLLEAAGHRVEPLLAAGRPAGLVATLTTDLAGVGERWALLAVADARGRRAVVVRGSGAAVPELAARLATAPGREAQAPPA